MFLSKQFHFASFHPGNLDDTDPGIATYETEAGDNGGGNQMCVCRRCHFVCILTTRL